MSPMLTMETQSKASPPPALNMEESKQEQQTQQVAQRTTPAQTQESQEFFWGFENAPASRLPAGNITPPTDDGEEETQTTATITPPLSPAATVFSGQHQHQHQQRHAASPSLLELRGVTSDRANVNVLGERITENAKGGLDATFANFSSLPQAQASLHPHIQRGSAPLRTQNTRDISLADTLSFMGAAATLSSDNPTPTAGAITASSTNSTSQIHLLPQASDRAPQTLLHAPFHTSQHQHPITPAHFAPDIQTSTTADPTAMSLGPFAPYHDLSANDPGTTANWTVAPTSLPSTPQTRPKGRIQGHRRSHSWEHGAALATVSESASPPPKDLGASYTFATSSSGLPPAPSSLTNQPTRNTPSLPRKQWLPDPAHHPAPPRGPPSLPPLHSLRHQPPQSQSKNRHSLPSAEDTSPLSSPDLSPQFMPQTAPHVPEFGTNSRANTPPPPPALPKPIFAASTPSRMDHNARVYHPHERIRVYPSHTNVPTSQTPKYLQPFSHPQHFLHPHGRATPPYHLEPRPNTYHQQRFAQPGGQQPINLGYSVTAISPTNGPPVHPRNPRTSSAISPHASVSSSTSPCRAEVLSLSGSTRSSPEVLKTLLRKKACLYEPGTSSAIALVTWLVGRRLALSTGYFSRQHLQSGVHSVVSQKIESGAITRTKVNRCMQIILNSCFHYIIPRPDGTEECGDSFRILFSSKAANDDHLLGTLPTPWDDLEVNEDSVVAAGAVLPASADKSDDEEDAFALRKRARSPARKLASVTSSVPNSPSSIDGATRNVLETKDLPVAATGGGANKRAVLLCFNENVRSAEDVFRCHNEFIRDAANSANLILTANEWNSFYSGDEIGILPDQHSKKLKSTSPAPSRHLEGQNDSTRTALPAKLISSKLGEVARMAPGVAAPAEVGPTDILGCMGTSELCKFRTTWCAKRYDHDPSLCGFAHADVNGGWLRRDPDSFRYSEVMCPHIETVRSDIPGLDGCLLNSCPKGRDCEFSHSKEEVDYHPKQYKKNVCMSNASHPHQCCSLRDICPNLHTAGSLGGSSQSPPHQFSNRHGGSRRGESPSRSRGGHNKSNAATGTPSSRGLPSGSPMMYVGPAPESEFERSLMLPGLKSLFRRQCSTLHACYRGYTQENCRYSIFGDDWGLPGRIGHDDPGF